MIDQRHTVCSPILATCSILAVPAAWPRRPSLAEAFESKILQEISPRNSNHRPSVGEIFALIESPFKGAPTVIAAIAMTLIHRQAVRHGLAGTADVTSLVITLKLASVHGPNEVTIATSGASPPRAIKIRPMRGLLWRASNVYQRRIGRILMARGRCAACCGGHRTCTSGRRDKLRTKR